MATGGHKNTSLMRRSDLLMVILASTVVCTIYACGVKVVVHKSTQSRIDSTNREEETATSTPPGDEITNMTSFTPVVVNPAFIEGTASSPRCELSKSLVYTPQDTGSWCWAASSQATILYLRDQKIDQCQLVSDAFKADLTASASNLSCCDFFESPGAVPESVAKLCDRGGWPEWIFQAHDISFERTSWANGQILDWTGLTDQICENRPFIFVVGWTKGGRHSSVVGGYHTTANQGDFVEVYDHAPYDFYAMPFDEFRGQQEDFKHEYDYLDIQ